MVYPIVAVCSSGSKLWDVDGNKVRDGPARSHLVIPQRSSERLWRGSSSRVQIGPQSPFGKVAKAICELTGTERVTFCNTGSEAVLAAMRWLELLLLA